MNISTARRRCISMPLTRKKMLAIARIYLDYIFYKIYTARK